MRHPVLTPCCQKGVRWDGELWYCNHCSKSFVPAITRFEKPFPKKAEPKELLAARSCGIRGRLATGRLILVQSVALFLRF